MIFSVNYAIIIEAAACGNKFMEEDIRMKEKTSKYEIGVGLLCALAVFAGYISPIYSVAFLLAAVFAGLDINVQKAAANASVFYAILYIIVKCCTYLSNWWLQFCGLFTSMYQVYKVLTGLNLFGYIRDILNFAEFVIMIIFFIVALKKASVKIPVISKIVDKFFPAEEGEATEPAEKAE